MPVVLRGVRDLSVSRVGLDFPRTLHFEKWLTVGRTLAASQGSLAWCLGDWLMYGEESYNGRYRDAVEIVALNYQTLRNYAWVARRFPLSRRRETLSFGHHAEVASLSEPEQDFWFRKAEEFNWSRNRLRSEVRSSLRERSPATEIAPASDALAEKPPIKRSVETPESTREPARLLLETDDEKAQRWTVAATVANLSVEEWALKTLDDAAQSHGNRLEEYSGARS